MDTQTYMSDKGSQTHTHSVNWRNQSQMGGLCQHEHPGYNIAVEFCKM